MGRTSVKEEEFLGKRQNPTPDGGEARPWIQSVAQRTDRSSVKIAKIYGQKPNCTEASKCCIGVQRPF